jgi:hypothetical protein
MTKERVQRLVVGLVTVLLVESFELVKVDHGPGQGVPARRAGPISTDRVWSSVRPDSSAGE